MDDYEYNTVLAEDIDNEAESPFDDLEEYDDRQVDKQVSARGSAYMRMMNYYNCDPDRRWTRQEIIDVVERYHAAREYERDKIMLDIIQLLAPKVFKWVFFKIRYIDMNYYEDYCSEALMECIKRFEKYDPERSTYDAHMLSFFKYAVDDSVMNTWRAQHGISRYENAIDKKIKSAIAKLTENREEFSIARIANMTGITISKVQQSLDRISFNAVPTDEMGIFDSKASHMLTPEHAVLHDESEDTLAYSLACLDQDEQRALALTYGLLNSPVLRQSELQAIELAYGHQEERSEDRFAGYDRATKKGDENKAYKLSSAKAAKVMGISKQRFEKLKATAENKLRRDSSLGNLFDRKRESIEKSSLN